MRKTIAVIVEYNQKVKLETFGLKKIVVKNDAGHSFSSAVNRGIEKAFKKGCQQVLVLNPDTKLKKGFLKPLEKVLDRKNVGIVAPVIKHPEGFDHGGRINWRLGRPSHINKGKIVLKKPAEREFVSGACMLIKKEVFDQIGLFDEDFFLYFEDVDFCIRAKQAGFKTLINPRTVINHQTSPASYKSWRKTYYLLQSNFRFICKWLAWQAKPIALMYLLVLGVKMVLGKIIHD